MAKKEYSTFSRVSGLELYHEIVLCHIQDICSVEGGCYPSAEIQLVYSRTAPTNFGYWANMEKKVKSKNERKINCSQ